MVTDNYRPPVIWKKELDSVRRRWIKRFVLLNAVYWIIPGTGMSSLVWLTDLLPDASRIQWMKRFSSREAKILNLERRVKQLRLKEEIYQILKGNGISLSQGMGIAESILIQSETLQLPPELILSIMQKETNHNNGTVSRKGAMGIMQIMPVTWDEYVRKLDLGVSRQAALDPVVNIRVGAHVVKDLYDHYKRKTDSD
jgi:soluble lytic murein transglycosylase-like protein